MATHLPRKLDYNQYIQFVHACLQYTNNELDKKLIKFLIKENILIVIVCLRHGLENKNYDSKH